MQLLHYYSDNICPLYLVRLMPIYVGIIACSSMCSVSKRYVWQEAMFCLTSGETRRGSDQGQWAAIKEQILRGESVGKDTEGHKEQRELSPGAAKQAKRTCKTLGIHCPLCCHCLTAWRIIADVGINYLFACGRALIL